MQIKIVLLLLVFQLLTGCATLGYYAQSVHGQLELIGKRQPIEELLADSEVSEKLRQRLELVLKMRDFASTELGLPDNASYRSYADLGRKAMVWSVVATPEFSVQPKQWCYPVVGCAAYRGYFSHQQAEQFAEGLGSEGLDVVVEPVPAYSTLGWFDDPVPNTVINWSEPHLAGLIFHELAHQKLYFQDDSRFNEAFAVAVEQIGVERWMLAQHNSEGFVHWQQQKAREEPFFQLLLLTRQRLVTLFARPLSVAEMRKAKVAEFEQLRSEYASLKRSWNGYTGYDRWFERKLNNARLASVATYRHLLPGLLALYAQSDRDLARFYQACGALAALTPEKRSQQLERLIPPAASVTDVVVF
ncbi:aminopeptidase [Pseudomonadota bacterium]